MMFLKDLTSYRKLLYPRYSLFLVFIKLLIAHPAVIAVALFRFGSWGYRQNFAVFRVPILFVHWLVFPAARLITGVQLLPSTSVGEGLVLLHYGTTIINPRSVIGKECILYHNVLLAADVDGSSPTIGDHVQLGANVTVFGGITVGNNAIVGTGSVVTKDIPDSMIAVGNPARPIKPVVSDAFV